MRTSLYITLFISCTVLLFCSCSDNSQQAEPQKSSRATLSEMARPVLSGRNVYDLGTDIELRVTYPASDWQIVETLQKEIESGDRKPWHIRVNGRDFRLDHISPYSQWFPPASSLMTEISRELVLNRDSSDQSLQWKSGAYRVAFVFKDITVFHPAESEQQIHYDEWVSNEISFQIANRSEQTAGPDEAAQP
jgi:hypothetical protein